MQEVWLALGLLASTNPALLADSSMTHYMGGNTPTTTSAVKAAMTNLSLLGDYLPTQRSRGNNHNHTFTRVTSQPVWVAPCLPGQVYTVSGSTYNRYNGRYQLQEGNTSWGFPYYTSTKHHWIHLYHTKSGIWAIGQGRVCKLGTYGREGCAELAEMKYMSSEGVAGSSPPATGWQEVDVEKWRQGRLALKPDLRVEAECLWSVEVNNPLLPAATTTTAATTGAAATTRISLLDDVLPTKISAENNHNLTSTRATPSQLVWLAQVYTVSGSRDWDGRYQLEKGNTSWGSLFYTSTRYHWRRHLYRRQESGSWALGRGHMTYLDQERVAVWEDMKYRSSERVGGSSPPTTGWQEVVTGRWRPSPHLRVEAECLRSAEVNLRQTQSFSVTGFEGYGCYELQDRCTNWGSPYYRNNNSHGYFLYHTTESGSWALGVLEGGVEELRPLYTSIRLDSGWREVPNDDNEEEILWAERIPRPNIRVKADCQVIAAGFKYWWVLWTLSPFALLGVVILINLVLKGPPWVTLSSPHPSPPNNGFRSDLCHIALVVRVPAPSPPSTPSEALPSYMEAINMAGSGQEESWHGELPSYNKAINME